MPKADKKKKSKSERRATPAARPPPEESVSEAPRTDDAKQTKDFDGDAIVVAPVSQKREYPAPPMCRFSDLGLD
ncbi:hypothetical protein LPJ70_006208, partial [Coemansia sp. RSA 2708]